MKRAAVLGLSLCLIVALFSFPVHAEGFGYGSSRTGSYLTNNVNVVADVIEARATQVGGSGSSIVWQKDFLVTVQIQNLVDSPVLVNGLRFSLDFSSGANVGIISYESYSSDAYISNDGNLMFSIVPSNDFSYSNGIVVPPSESIWVVGTITAQRVSDSNSSFNLSSVSVPSFTTARSDNYPYGATVNWSPLISAIDQYFNTQHIDNNNILTLLGSIKVDSSAAVTSLSTLISNLSYTGSYFTFPFTSATSRNLVSNFSSSSIRVVRNVGSPFLVNETSYYNPADDTSHVDYTVRYPFLITIAITNNSGKTLRSDAAYHIFNGLFPTGVGNIFIDYFYSDSYSSFRPEVNYFYLKHSDLSYGYLGSDRFQITYLHGYIDLPYGQSVSWADFTIDRPSDLVVSDLYYPASEYTILRDLYVNLVNPSSSSVHDPSDLDVNSGTVEGQVETIHDQEMQYFQQNQQAIESVGLSNFRFNENYVNAFSMITTQFSSLWNALSDYSLIYIFTLLLSLATYIIRHEPTTKVKQYRSSVAAERAERISYYGSMNASRRAGSNTSPEMRAAVRRLNRK